jgi:hypothetical protein
MDSFRSVTGKPANLRNRNRVLGKNQLAKSMEENFQMPVDALAHIQVLQENCLERPILKMQVHWQKVVVLFFSEPQWNISSKRFNQRSGCNSSNHSNRKEGQSMQLMQYKIQDKA